MIAGLDCDLHHLFLLKHHLKLMAKLNLKKESLKARNNKLHAEIWRMNREKDSTQTIDRMRIEIEANNRELREIEYLKRADGRMRQMTFDYIESLNQN